MSAALAIRPGHTLVRRAWRNVLRIKLALIDRRRYESLQLERVCELPFVVLPDVFNPRLLRSGELLARQVEHIAPGARVLELGSGAGAAAVIAASRACRVTAVDINPAAVRCTRINALLNDVDVDVRQGDLFAPLDEERFDVVLFNPPYYRGTPADSLDHAWRSLDVMDRFARDLPRHLTSNGRALVILSSDGERDAFVEAWRANGLATRVVAEHDLINETLSVYEVSRPLSQTEPGTAAC